jgi:hypothetical protein
VQLLNSFKILVKFKAYEVKILNFFVDKPQHLLYTELSNALKFTKEQGMKIKGNQGVGIETNRQAGEEMDFGIGDASVIIEILRNRLYSNPKQTLVQEYLCNGRDATREKSVKTPMKVTLPTNLDPVFKVRDYGVGISPDRIRDVFVLYGKSTKRNTDTQTGGFGIGAKSAWAYTDSFTVITYIDGVQREYLAHIGDNQNGKLVPLAETPTSEPNGTEIQIGVKKQDIQDFVNATYRATMFWDVRPTFAGITEPEIPAFYKKMNCVMHRDNWAIYKSGDLTRFIDGTNYYNYGRSGSGGIVMVVDGIPYKLSNKFHELPNVRKFQEYLHHDMVLTVAVGNGDVEVSASREAISDSEYSQKQINALAEDVLKSIEKQIAAELDKVKSFSEYVKAHRNINATLNNNLPTEKRIGKTTYSIDGRHCLKADIFNHVSITSYVLQNIRNGKQQVSSDKAVHLYLSKETKFFYQDNLEEGPNKTRDRIRTHFAGDTNKQVYLIESLPEGSKARFKQLIEEVEAVALSTIELPVVEKTKSKRASNKGKVCLHYLTYDTNRSRHYPTLGRTSVHVEVENIDTDEKHLMIEMKDSKLPQWTDNASFLAFLKFVTTKGYKIVAVSPQVKTKVVELENVQDCKDFMDNLHTHLPLTAQELNYIRKKSFKGSGDFRKLMPFLKDLEDESIQELLETQNEIDRMDNAQVQEVPERLMEIYKAEIAEIEKEMKQKQSLVEKLAKKYPLVGAIGYYNGDENRKNAVLKDLLKYVNMKYNESND